MKHIIIKFLIVSWMFFLGISSLSNVGRDYPIIALALAIFHVATAYFVFRNYRNIFYALYAYLALTIIGFVGLSYLASFVDAAILLVPISLIALAARYTQKYMPVQSGNREAIKEVGYFVCSLVLFSAIAVLYSYITGPTVTTLRGPI